MGRRRARTRGEKLFSGAGMIVLAVVMLVIVWFNPSGLTIPYWVLAVLLSTFVFAGLWTIFGALGWAKPESVALVLMIAVMGLPGVWLLWNPGTLSCSVTGALSFLAGDGCRIALGLGGSLALMVAVWMGVAVVTTWNRKSDVVDSGTPPAAS